jgi:hypothetical protein
MDLDSGLDFMRSLAYLKSHMITSSVTHIFKHVIVVLIV